MRIKTSVDAHQNGRRCAGERKTIALVSRPDAEPRPFPSAFLPVLVGSSALFDGYLPSFFSGCFERINKKPFEMSFQPRIPLILTDLKGGCFCRGDRENRERAGVAREARHLTRLRRF